MTGRFSPDKVIDRRDEQDAFAALLAPEDESRVMTIRDKGQSGKSELLALLRWRAADSDIPVCLVALDQLRPQTPFTFVRTIERTLRTTGLEFPRFRKMEDARLQQGLGGISVEINVREIKDSAKVTGLHAGGDINIDAGGDLDELLRDRAVDAFVKDLRSDYAGLPMVLLLDAYEQCGEELAAWLRLFLKKEILDAEAALPKLAVVIAGREVPVDHLRGILRERFDVLVRPFPSLSPWEPEHVRTLIDMNGVEPTDTDVNYFHEKLASDWSVGFAIEMLELFNKQAER